MGVPSVMHRPRTVSCATIAALRHAGDAAQRNRWRGRRPARGAPAPRRARSESCGAGTGFVAGRLMVRRKPWRRGVTGTHEFRRSRSGPRRGSRTSPVRPRRARLVARRAAGRFRPWSSRAPVRGRAVESDVPGRIGRSAGGPAQEAAGHAAPERTSDRTRVPDTSSPSPAQGSRCRTSLRCARTRPSSGPPST